MPVVTVIMPAYQAAATIAEAIESVRQQTWQDWELIVVDDASTDGTGDVVRETGAGDSRARVIGNGCNLGAASSVNNARRASRSPFVTILDVDDIASLQRREQQVQFFERNAKVSVADGPKGDRLGSSRSSLK